MRSTLFFIPHEFAGVPLFGFGWLLGCLVLAAAIWVVWSLARKQPTAELLAALPVWLVAAAIVTLVLPQVEVVLPSGEVAGLPIRGYGVLVCWACWLELASPSIEVVSSTSFPTLSSGWDSG